MSDQAAYRYHLLDAALRAFDRSPAALDADELSRARGVALRATEIESRILGAEPRQRVTVSRHDIERALASIAGRFERCQTFHEALEAAGLDEADLDMAIARRLTVDARLKAVATSVEAVSDADIDAFHARHASRFAQPERRRLAHVLITVDPAYPENTAPAARARIEAVRDRVIAAPERFEDEARRHSECPSALAGGVLGLVTRDDLPAAVAERAFNLAPGAMSEVVASDIGFHLLRCDAVEPAQAAPSDETRRRIATALHRARGEQAKRRWIRALEGGLPTRSTTSARPGPSQVHEVAPCPS